MTLIINGETKEFSDNSTLQNIITNLQIEDKVMAAAVNMNIVKKDDWNNFIPKNDDKIELLQFVGGGWFFMSREKGDFAEKRAISFLEDLNFKIIEKNFYAKKLGEIDIIALKDNIYHFCEVKSAPDYETAINNITNSKLSKIKRSVDYYLQTKKLDVAFCIDAIIIDDKEITFLENITLWFPIILN